MQDEKIRRGLLTRQEESMAQVMSQYTKYLWRVACAVMHDVGTPQDAEECVADAFWYLWEYAEKFEPARGSLKTYLSVLVRSRAMDRRRQILRRRKLVEDETILLLRMTNAPMDRDMHHKLTHALHTLSPMQREILLRRYYYDQKPRDIALALGISARQVTNYLYRTKTSVRIKLDETKESFSNVPELI